MDFILSYISEELIYALGWTVIHSLWQGAIIALALAFMMPALQKKTAKFRYEISALSMFLVFIFALCTFLYMYESAMQTPEGFSYLLQQDMDVIILTGASSGDWLETTNSWAAYFNRNMPLIVSIWLMGGLFFLLRLLGGYAYVQGLKVQHNYPMSDHWQQKLATLIHQTPIKRPISLLESALVKVPMVIGYFKPAILLPIGIVNSLSDDEVEAILAHELAHIHRNDYLINIILSFFEILFYYNPAVWWISANVRTERENCCDDIGVQLCGNSLTYAKALVSIQEMHHAAPSFAMSFSGRKDQLLQRIKRILNQPQNKSATMEKLTATCMLLLALLIISVSAGTPFEKPSIVEASSTMISEAPSLLLVKETEVPRDTLPTKKNRQQYVKTTDDQKVEMTVENGEIVKLKIDGENIPESKIEDYSDLTEELLDEMQNGPSLFAPPSPPAPPAPPAAPSPRAPSVFPTPPSPPAPPMAPKQFRFRNKKTKTITTNQNEEGDMVIIIEADEALEPIEIIIDDESQVIRIDGSELEAGDTAFIIEEGNFFSPSIGGLGINNHKAFFQLKGLAEGTANGQNIFWLNGGDSSNLLGHVDWSEEDLATFRTQRKELQESYRQLSRERSENLASEQKEMLERLAQIRAKEKELQKEQIHLLEKRAKNQVIAQRERVREMQENYFEDKGRFQIFGKSISTIMTNQLLEDQLIESEEKFSFQLSNKKFKVNGKKMSKELHQKYKAIYLKHSKTKEGTNFNIQVSNN